MNKSQVTAEQASEQKDSDVLQYTQCIHCRAVFPAEANFCSSCGTDVITTDSELPFQQGKVTTPLKEHAKEYPDTEVDDKTIKLKAVILPTVKVRYYATNTNLRSLLTNGLLVLMPLCSLIFWLFSLKSVNLQHMNDLGLVSTFSPATIGAVVLVTVCFCLSLRQPQMRIPLLLLQLGILIFMLYGVTALVEEAPRFDIVWRHAGYTEYITRTGSVDPNLDGYFSWPGFFVLSAFVTLAAGYHDILSYAAWAPVFFNFIYLAPLYLIFSTFTLKKRLIWLAILFFYLTNWIGQDYFSPQGLNYFLYLTIIAMLLKWFAIPLKAGSQPFGKIGERLGHSSRLLSQIYKWLILPNRGIPSPTSIQPWQRIMLLAMLLLVFAFSVFSHPLTPFFIIASVTLLVVLRRCNPGWLPIVMIVMTVLWIFGMAQTFLAGHLALVLGTLGKVNTAISSNVTGRVHGDPEHTFIAEIRVVMTVFVWGLAFIGAFLRIRKGYRDVIPILLAIAPFPLIVTQSYGGEMLLRIYLFSLPPMVFFAASLFSAVRMDTIRKAFFATTCISILLLGGFFFTRYGNERMDYMTNNEVTGVKYLYSIAPDHSVFVTAWDGGPLQFRDYEKYTIDSLSSANPNDVAEKNVNAIASFVQSHNSTQKYLLFTRSELAAFDSTSGLVPGTLNQLEGELLRSDKFKLIYSNPDVQIFVLVTKTTGGAQ